MKSLRVGRSGNRIPVGARFSTCIQTGPGTHPASCTMDAGSLTATGAWPKPPTSSSAEVKERVELYLCSLSGPSWPVLGWALPYTRARAHMHSQTMRWHIGLVLLQRSVLKSATELYRSNSKGYIVVCFGVTGCKLQCQFWGRSIGYRLWDKGAGSETDYFPYFIV